VAGGGEGMRASHHLHHTPPADTPELWSKAGFGFLINNKYMAPKPTVGAPSHLGSWTREIQNSATVLGFRIQPPFWDRSPPRELVSFGVRYRFPARSLQAVL
jgi:hypothetical protein